MSTPLRGGFFRYFTQFIKQLPIRRIDFNKKFDKNCHDGMVKLVDEMMTLYTRLASAKTNHDKSLLQRKLDMTEREIDPPLDGLYGLTKEDIAMLEEGSPE